MPTSTFMENVSSVARAIDIDGAAVVVESGGIVEVPDELAGSEPTDETPGAGFLAQPDVWRKASKTKAKRAASADDLVEVELSEEQG